MILKKFLFVIFLFSLLNAAGAQSTWMYNLSYHSTDGFSMIYNDNVCGINDAAISADNSLYIVAKIWPDHSYYLYKYDLITDTVLWSASIYAGHYISSRIIATADSGCINLADGVYSLKVYSDKKINNFKFIKFN